MSKASDKASPKTSFSPFSNPKKTTANDSLYKPPSAELSSVEDKYEDPINADVAQTSETSSSYLESMSGPRDGLKTSYSPFGTVKAQAKDSLYDPPAEVASQSENGLSSLEDETVEDVEEVESPVNGGSYLDSMAKTDRGVAGFKSSYSPFGTSRTWQTPSNALYDAPGAINDESIASEPSTADSPEPATSAQGSYLNGLNDSNAPSGVKKSYSPFGTKPKAVSDNGMYSSGNSY
eukprot:jgi/Psemu1/304763/fgenesh1_kg.168_\